MSKVSNKHKAQWTSKIMKNMAKDAGGKLPDGFSFAILVFPVSNPSIGNYISNADRDDMIVALRETADRLERNKNDEPCQFD